MKYYKIVDTKGNTHLIRAVSYRKALQTAKSKNIDYMINLNEPELFQKES